MSPRRSCPAAGALQPRGGVEGPAPGSRSPRVPNASPAGAQPPRRGPAPPPLVVLVDTREQLPWFGEPIEGVHVVRATLPTGDVTFAGARGLYAIERKSLADLVGSLTWGRDRFWREVERLAVLGALGGAAAVIVEGDVAGLDRELAGRRVPPWTVVASTLAIVAEGVPVVWAGNRPNAERCALWLLRRWAARVANGGRS